MRINEVTIRDLKDYANELNDDPEIDKIFTNLLVACKSYIKNYTGLTEEQLVEKEDLTIALMVLVNEMYDNRSFTVQQDKVNKVVKSILDMHSVNLL